MESLDTTNSKGSNQIQKVLSFTKEDIQKKLLEKPASNIEKAKQNKKKQEDPNSKDPWQPPQLDSHNHLIRADAAFLDQIKDLKVKNAMMKENQAKLKSLQRIKKELKIHE